MMAGGVRILRCERQAAPNPKSKIQNPKSNLSPPPIRESCESLFPPGEQIVHLFFI